MYRTDVTLRRIVIAKTRGISAQSMTMYKTQEEDPSHIVKRPREDLHSFQCLSKTFGGLTFIVSPNFL